VFDCDAIERPLEGGNRSWSGHHDAIALQYLSQSERDKIQWRVREVLTQRLDPREPSQDDVAEILNMSARTLQRKRAIADHRTGRYWTRRRRVSGPGLPLRAAAHGQDVT